MSPSSLTVVELSERFDDLVAAVQRIADALEALAEPTVVDRPFSVRVEDSGQG